MNCPEIRTQELLPSTENSAQIEIAKIENRCQRHPQNVLQFLSSTRTTIHHLLWPCEWYALFCYWKSRNCKLHVSIGSYRFGDFYFWPSAQPSIWSAFLCSKTVAMLAVLHWKLNEKYHSNRRPKRTVTFHTFWVVRQLDCPPVSNRVVLFLVQSDWYPFHSHQLLKIARLAIKQLELIHNNNNKKRQLLRIP